MYQCQPISDFEKQLLAQVSEEQLMDFTQNVSKEVRLSGTPEELRAFEYAKQQLESFGYQTELLFSKSYISHPQKAELTIGDEQIPCITHSMAQPTLGLESEVVYVEKGTSNDYCKYQVKGKVVLIDGLAIPGSVNLAQKNGAVGAIFINAKLTHEMIVSTVWGTPDHKNFDELPKIPVVSINLSSGEAIKQKLTAGQNLCQIMTQVETGFRSIPCLVAELKENSEDNFVLLSGHIDSWHYGVMDNGTANATMLEVARIMAKNQAKLRRNLRIAFWSGHSHGRYAGSAWYCDNNWEELREKCVMHINVDSLGAKGATVLTEGNCMEETKDLGKDVISSITGQIFEGSRFGRAGDQSFWGNGIPSLFMGLSEQALTDDPASRAFAQLFGSGNSGGFGWWWHTTEDTLDKIDPQNLVRDCSIYVLVVYRTLSNLILPLNQMAAAKDIEAGLVTWQNKASEHFDLSLALERVKQLKEKINNLDQIIDNLPKNDNRQSEMINKYLMQLSRILVPLNYVKESIFAHDTALKQNSVPKLSDIQKLVSVEKDSDKYQFILTSLVRKRNEVNYELKQAISLVDNTLQHLK